MGFWPASERLASVPASHRGRAFGVSSVFLVLALLLSPFVWDDASARAADAPSSAQISSFLAPDMFDGGKIDAVAASKPVSTDVWSKIEAIRRMGGRGLSRPSWRHDLAPASIVWKLADSTENSVRIVTKCRACQALVNEGLGRAPPRLNL